MPDVSVQIKGLEPLEKKIGGLATFKVVYHALMAGALHVKRKIAIYPRASEANVPNQRRWYQRGYGPKWMTRTGEVHGRKTSKTLGRRWTIGGREGGKSWVGGNSVPYGIYVQGEKQAWFHAARGWKTIETVADEEEKTVTQFVQQEIDKELAKP